MAEPNMVVVGRKPVSSYVLAVIVMFNQGVDEVVIKARGEAISKAVEIYNALRDRLGDSIELVNAEIGSEYMRSRRTSYIKIKVRRVF